MKILSLFSKTAKNLKSPSRLRLGLFFGVSCLLISCQSRETELQERLFQAQKRLLKLEKTLKIKTNHSSKRENALSINMAEAQTRQSEHESNFKSIKGELENFRHFLGIQDLKADEMAKLRLDNRLVSMKKNADELKTVNKQMKQIEKRQKQILKHLEKLAKSRLASVNAQKAKKKKRARTRAKIKNLAQAKKAFKEKRYTHIVQDLPRFMNKLKGSRKVSYQFIYAESLYKLGRISEAALTYDELLLTGKDSNKIERIYLRMGDCFRQMGDATTAQIYYEELIEKYPKANEVVAATSHLSKLRKKKN